MEGYVAFLVLFLGVVSIVWCKPTGRASGENETRNALILFNGLNEAFKEVKELMEDTQDILQDAVKEMEADQEHSRNEISESDLYKLPSNYHNETEQDIQIGNTSVHIHHAVNKVVDNKTGSAVYSEEIITSIRGEKSKRNYECIFDEDCGRGNYCSSAIMTSKCLPCKTQAMNCSRNEECCQGLCVWGQCTNDAKKGESGTICENQGDCNKGTCCAIQTHLPFSICTPLATEGKRCSDPLSQNELLNLIWTFDPESALDYCPCVEGLKCRAGWSNLFFTCERPNKY